MSMQRMWRRDAVESDGLVAAGNPGTIVFDPASVLCDSERCSVVREGVPLYTDQNHLSRPGALLLTPALQDALVQSRR